MSKKSRAKRATKVQADMLNKLSPLDRAAESEAEAIGKAYTSRTMDFGIRLNSYYWCDGFKFNTGKKHRRNCTGMTAIDRKPKQRNPQCRSVDLRSRNVHRRVDVGKVAYDTENLRRIQSLVYYKAGLNRNRIG